MSRGPSDLVHQLPPLPLLIIKCHLTLTVEIGMPRTPQMIQEAVQTAPRALYGLILHDGGVNTRGPKGYLITRVHYQTVQAWNLHPPHLSEPSSACRKSGSPCSCTAHPGIQLSSARSFGSIDLFLPDEGTLDIVDIASTVLRISPEFLRSELPKVW